MKTVKTQTSIFDICERMEELERYTEPLVTTADTWVLLGSTHSPLDPSEEVVSRALRCMARIKLNRHAALSEVRMFTDEEP